MSTRKCAGAALFVMSLTGPMLGSALSAPSGDFTNGPIAVRVSVSSALNVRATPSTSGSIIGTASNGTVYAAVAKSGDFYKVWFGDRTGWMHGTYLSDSTSFCMTVTASALNVRTNAGTSNQAIGLAPEGAVYPVTGSSGDWRRVTWGDRSGWVNVNYLRASKAGDGNSGGSTGGGTSTGGGSTGGGSTGGGSTGGGTSTGSHGSTVSSKGFIQLNASGPGFFTYTADSGRWGKPKLIYGIERVARRWITEHPAGTPARLGIGDISLKNGGPFNGHASHQKGVDADFNLPRNDGQELPRIDRFSSKYSRTGTQKAINLVRAELPVTMIFFNDPKVTGRQNWPNHDNHFHVRISP